MKPSNKTESEVWKVYEKWLNSYINGDVKTYNYLLDDEYHFIGSALTEEFLSRKDSTDFFEATGDQFVGKTQLRNETKIIEQFEEIVFITHLFDAWFLKDEEWSYYARFRFTSTLQKKKEGWRFIYQHFSIPDGKTQEGETIGYDQINEENIQLREAIQRRTVELEHKNRELAVEASLERVRSRTMAMQSSDELKETAMLLFQQVDALGIKTFACGFNIWDDDKKYATVWMAGENRFQDPFKTKSDVDIYSLISEAEQRGESLFILEQGGKELEEHYKYLVTIPEFKKLAEAGLTFPTFQIIHCAYFSKGYLMFITYEPVPEAHDIFKRFANVFDQTYTRFLDLQKAEFQAREAKIETSLERMRSVAMNIRTSEEVLSVAESMYRELKLLDFHNIRNAQIVIKIKENETYLVCIHSDDTSEIIRESRYDTSPIIQQLYDELDASPVAFYQKELKGAEFDRWLSWRKGITDTIDDRIVQAKSISFYLFSIGEGHLGISAFNTISEEKVEVLKRFRNVFEMTYRRFLDLQKAEAQAKESQIEAALERVRSRSMAMHKSEELSETAEVLFEQINLLGEIPDRISIGIFNEKSNNVALWVTDQGGNQLSHEFFFSLDEPTSIAKIYNAWKEQKDYVIVDLTDKTLQKWLLFVKKNAKLPIDETNIKGRRVQHAAFFSQGFLLLTSHEPVTNEIMNLLVRFAKVFDQTYRRFLDLQKAEAQTREARIEAALERVRSRSMAMHKSEELLDVISVVSEQLQQLEFKFIHVSFANNDSSQDYKFWTAYKGMSKPVRFNTPYLDIAMFNNLREAQEKSIPFYTDILTKKEHNQWHTHLLNHGGSDVFSDSENEFIMSRGIARSTAINPNIMLILANYASIAYSDDENKIIERFGKVFEQSYTRFLDLQKAEEQAKESQIEIALERVRSRTMAMQNSVELAETSVVVFKQLIELGVEPNRLYIGIIKDDSGDIEFWATDEDGSKISTKFTGNKNKNKSVKKMYDSWAAQEKSLTIDMKGKELEAYFHYLGDVMHVPFKQGLLQKRRVQTIGIFSKGFIGIAAPEEQPEETTKLLERFAGVFNLTYTRFNDLQIAEAQTREAKIETALERVRARALAMQEPEELKKVAQVLRQEMGLLGVEELETCSIYINDKKAEDAECWYALKDLRSKDKKLVNDYFKLNLKDTWVGKQMLKFYKSTSKEVSIVMTGKYRKEWINYCEANSKPFQGYYGEEIPDRTYHLYKFSHGAIGAASAGEISEESWNLLKRAASVFSLAYSRFKDLTQSRLDLKQLKEEKKRAEDAFAELQLTQKQLIQSEKMASLGELTAGIAHEIQNPLNFVNNFSEVSNELIDEMSEEIEKGDMEEAKFIMADIKSNLEKINHHGKRADAIVKGMLQHSRTSSAEKEPTDINNLADEYLRLAYHGLRAKDKSFNATLETDFDESIGKISVIPQDIGRVILNLITNAFYACDEKKKSPLTPEGETKYEPTVSVSTKLISPLRGNQGGILISVSDNGNGIPKHILDKIFQPFFTTKPAGQGTGLGLSMSYDIVKAHSGELTVKTIEDEGTTFTIHLPN